MLAISETKIDRYARRIRQASQAEKKHGNRESPADMLRLMKEAAI
jgi:hypothetical protein